jgi:hypothetical protein
MLPQKRHKSWIVTGSEAVMDTFRNFAMALVSSRKVLAPLDAAAKGAITPNM